MALKSLCFKSNANAEFIKEVRFLVAADLGTHKIRSLFLSKENFIIIAKPVSICDRAIAYDYQPSHEI